MWTCEKCKTDWTDTTAQPCPLCSRTTSARPAKLICSECSTELADDWEYCPKCSNMPKKVPVNDDEALDYCLKAIQALAPQVDLANGKTDYLDHKLVEVSDSIRGLAADIRKLVGNGKELEKSTGELWHHTRDTREIAESGLAGNSHAIGELRGAIEIISADVKRLFMELRKND